MENNTKLNGIDISEHNGFIDFKEVKKKIDFVYIRSSFGRFAYDKYFEEYANKCIENEIPFGFYHYSYALNEEQAKEEAEFFIKTISKYKNKMELPLCIDIEDSDSYKKNHNFEFSKENITKILETECKILIEKGFRPIIYASLSWFTNYIDLQNETLKSCFKWLAWWNDKADSKVDKNIFSILQYTDKGEISGTTSKVDLNYSYVDFKKLKEYTENITKLFLIKFKTGLTDLDLQYLTCYKFGNFLVDKIEARLKKEPIDYDIPDIKKLIKNEYGLEEKTITYIDSYIYGDEVFNKLKNALLLKK